MTAFAVSVERARSGAGITVPSGFANAFSSPRMTEFCVVVLALANFRTVGTPISVLASSFVAMFPSPPRTARTGTVDYRTHRAISAGAVHRAIQTERPF